MVWCFIAWYGHGMVWLCGMVWYGMVWYGMVLVQYGAGHWADARARTAPTGFALLLPSSYKGISAATVPYLQGCIVQDPQGRRMAVDIIGARLWILSTQILVPSGVRNSAQEPTYN